MTSHTQTILLALIVGFVGLVTSHAKAALDPERLMLLVSAGRLGVTSETMASLGMSSAQANVLLSRLEANAGGFTTLQQTETLIAAQNTIIRDAEAALRLDPGDQQAELLRFAAENDRQIHQSSLVFQRSELLDALTTGLASGQSAALICRPETEFLSLDAPLRLGVTTPDQAKEAAWALRTESRAQAESESTPAEASSVLATLRSQPAVAAAIVARDTNLAAIELVVNAWLNGE